MIHKMNLFEEPFNKIKNKEKLIEVRCNDEKRQNIKVGDEIIFNKLPNNDEKLKTKVIELHKFNTFKELYLSFDFSQFGCKEYTMDRMLIETKEIYSKEKESKYGALGIRIEILG